MKLIVANSTEQARIRACELGLNPSAVKVIITGRRTDLPMGLHPLPGDVDYAPGWELGPRAADVLAFLQRAYAKRIRAV